MKDEVTAYENGAYLIILCFD